MFTVDVKQQYNTTLPLATVTFEPLHRKTYTLNLQLQTVLFFQELHHGSFINSMLPIIELGFKGLAAETKMASFTAWQHLIDNFATNPSKYRAPVRGIENNSEIIFFLFLNENICCDPSLEPSQGRTVSLRQF